MNTPTPADTKTEAQPGTADIDAALAKHKAYTRKLYAEVQQSLPSNHHPSCKPSDKDLVWKCSQCGEIESAESVEAERDQYKAQADKLAEALKKQTWATEALNVLGHSNYISNQKSNYDEAKAALAEYKAHGKGQQ